MVSLGHLGGEEENLARGMRCPCQVNGFGTQLVNLLVA